MAPFEFGDDVGEPKLAQIEEHENVIEEICGFRRETGVVFSGGSHDDLYGFLADFLCYLEPPASCQLGRITTGGQILQPVLNNRLERL